MFRPETRALLTAVGEGGSYGFIMASTIFLLLSALAFQLSLTHPTALLDPVAEPPVAEGYAACGEEEKQDIDNEGQGPSGSLDVSGVDGPGDCPMALLLSLHELVCGIAYQRVRRKEQRSVTHFLPEKSAKHTALLSDSTALTSSCTLSGLLFCRTNDRGAQRRDLLLSPLLVFQVFPHQVLRKSIKV